MGHGYRAKSNFVLLLPTVHFAIEEKLDLMCGNRHDKFHLGPTEERSFFQIPTGCNRLFK